MISSNCSISEFVKAVGNRDFLEIMHLADLEATEAERMLFRPATSGMRKEDCGSGYARSLKALIDYLRCRVNRVAVDSDELQLFQSLEETSIPSSVGIREIP
jgi:hypothetical protein